jgi:hypothetical protein
VCASPVKTKINLNGPFTSVVRVKDTTITVNADNKTFTFI